MSRKIDKIKRLEAVLKYASVHPDRARACNLITNYNKSDKKYNRGRGDLDIDFMIELMNKPCTHCGKVGWQYIGCNRLDNTKPHTKDNVEPCCWDCNRKLGNEYTRDLQSKQVYQYTLNGELVKIWSSAREAQRNGFTKTGIINCCNGGCFDKRRDKWVNATQHKGYRWSYEPL